MAEYTFTISRDFPGGQANTSKLHAEIEASSITGTLQAINTNGDSMCICFSASLTQADFDVLLGLIHSHVADVHAKIMSSVINAMEFGRSLMAEYATDNVLAGLTIADIQQLSLDLSEVQSHLLSGSLYVARDTLLNFTTTELITQDVLDKFVARIEEYLGI